MMVAMVILLAVMSVATVALIQAQKVTDGVALEANLQENLRAGMHFIVRDLMQAGQGIPQAGISIPNSATSFSAMNRPGTAGTFFAAYTVMPPVIPGWGLGTVVTTVDPTSNAILNGGFNTDIITILYADNTLVSTTPPASPPGPALNSAPINQPAPALPVCAGLIAASGLTVTVDPACFTMPGEPTPISVGNLIMFQNANGTALEYVTNVAGSVITFAAGDPADLNQTGLPNGTVANLNVTVTPTTITRIWMVTYYIDSVTNPQKPQLIRQVNYPNAPAVNPANPPQPVAETIENLTFSYDIVNSSDVAGTYGIPGPGNASQPILPDTPFKFRAVNASLSGRSEYPFAGAESPNYLRNSLSTQVSIRSLSFAVEFGTSSTPP
jgi:hypothetical protein